MKIRSGIVRKLSSDKTISVSSDYFVTIKKYNKKIKKTSKFLVHDPNNECLLGERIYFKFTKPISKKKNSIFVKKVSDK